jgi:hypothetical protein
MVSIHQALCDKVTLLNWVLGIAAMLVWIGPVAYYFRDELRTFWTRRNDKWFRQD